MLMLGCGSGTVSVILALAGEIVEVVIGVDTHFADEHSALRAWAIEGTGGHGTGLTACSPRLRGGHRAGPPQRAKRRGGAQSDPFDAIRAARKRCRGLSWACPVPRGTVKRCQCSSLPVVPLSRRQRWLGANYSLWSSPPPRSCGPGSGARRSRPWCTSPPGCGSAAAGTSRRPRPPPRCEAWPAAHVSSVRMACRLAVVLQVRPQCAPAGYRAGADADLDIGPVVLHVVGRVEGGQQAAGSEVWPQPAERVDGEHRVI